MFGTWSKNGFTKKSCKWSKNHFGSIKFFGLFLSKNGITCLPQNNIWHCFFHKKWCLSANQRGEAIIAFTRLPSLMAADKPWLPYVGLHTRKLGQEKSKSIWTRPQGCQRCQKNQNCTTKNMLMCFSTNIQPKLNKLQKT